MGLFITGNLLPQELSCELWEQAYEEALHLVNAYDFLDIIWNKDRYSKYGLTWCYAEKSKEREIDGHLGVAIYGAYAGCIDAEDQFLFRDLRYYLPKKQGSDEIIPPDPDALHCHDALIGRFYDIDELEKYTDCQRTVFGNKTQGYPHHVPLLAIGLLLEDRLGRAFTVHGDITRGQVKAAIEWANTVLEQPISLPCCMDNDKLLERLQAFVPKENQIDSFLTLTLCAKNDNMYQFLQKHFSENELSAYWKKEVSECIPGTLGASELFKKYFSMTDDLVMLTKACAEQYSPDEFAEELASTRVFEKDKNINDPVATLSSDSDSETPETIETTIGKLFAMLGGGFPRNSAVGRYIPLEQGIRDISLAYREIGKTDIDFDTLLRNAIEQANPGNKSMSDSIDILGECIDALEEETENIDIIAPEELVFYKPGDVIAPGIIANLKGIRDFVDAHKEETVKNYLDIYTKVELNDNKFTRMAIIVHRCTKLLPKTIWDTFEQRIENDDFFFTLLGLHVLKSDTLPISYYVKGLLYNPILFDWVLLSDDMHSSESISEKSI